MQPSAEDLLTTYLGQRSGERVLAGRTRRGDGEKIHAVIWLCDLRDSTRLSESIPLEDFFRSLNEFFDCTAGAVLEHGGEVLSYIGDAVLAIFTIAGTDRPLAEACFREEGACAAALAAARGAQAQMDYATYDLDFTSEGRRRVNLFSYLLGYSRRQYLRFVEAQDFATTVREHIRAFEHLGGVAATCLYDNMKVVVSGYDGDDPVYNPRFLAFAAHYGFRPIACRPRRPQTKGKVERPFGYVESSLLGGRTFRGLSHLNETTAWWLAEVADVRVHRQTKARPIDRHTEEQQFTPGRNDR
jgi:hypothetical protein